MRTSTYTYHTLPNGLRIVIEEMPDVPSAAAGFLARTGARDETREVAGVSHFLEHMMFKGTPKRTWHEINSAFDAMGSTYNAFTSNDRTFYYGWVPRDCLREQIELLADMMRSTLPPSEFEMEKNVILEEIARSKDNLVSVAFDVLMEQAFAGHPLAWPVLGYEETIRSLRRDAMAEYFARRYAADNLILIVAGNVNPGEVIGWAEAFCGAWAPARDGAMRVAPELRNGSAGQTVSRFQQQVIMWAFPAPPGCVDDAELASATATILGGDNSRIFWNVVQKGLCPRAGAFHLDFSDAGLMILWAMCDPKHCEAAFSAIRGEAERMQSGGVTADEVARIRNKRLTSLAAEGEAPYDRLKLIMDDVDYRGRARTLEERLAVVDAIEPSTVGTYLARYPVTGEGFLVSVGPSDWRG